MFTRRKDDNMSKGRGWHKHSHEHSLASRGIKVKSKNSMARMGASNGRWKGGTSKTYYRRIAGCKPNDGKIVHHKDHNKLNPNPSNLEVLNNRGISAAAKHNKIHPEKGRKNKRD